MAYSMNGNGKKAKKTAIIVVAIVAVIAVVAALWKTGWLAKAKDKLTGLNKKPAQPYAPSTSAGAPDTANDMPAIE